MTDRLVKCRATAGKLFELDYGNYMNAYNVFDYCADSETSPDDAPTPEGQPDADGLQLSPAGGLVAPNYWWSATDPLPPPGALS